MSRERSESRLSARSSGCENCLGRDCRLWLFRSQKPNTGTTGNAAQRHVFREIQTQEIVFGHSIEPFFPMLHANYLLIAGCMEEILPGKVFNKMHLRPYFEK
jgi:hypothetical protein